MRLRYKIGLVLIVLTLAVCLMTYQSYALWIYNKVAEQENIVEVGCFSVSYTEENPITMTNTYPVSDQKGLSGTPYTFTITNTCSIDSNYVVTLNTLNTNSIEKGSVVIGYDNNGAKIEEQYEAFNMKDKVKFAIADSEVVPTSGTNLGEYANINEHINNDTEELKKKIVNLEESIILASGTLKGKTGEEGTGETKTYKLYLWFDEKDKNEIMGKSFNASINIINKATIVEPYQPIPQKVLDKLDTSDENGNGLYTVDHSKDGNTLGEEWKANPEYRYAGPNPNNYVEFNGELWRIIGLVNVKTSSGKVEQRLKLIRKSSVGSYSFDISTTTVNKGNGVNEWSESDLMKLLNPGYDNNQDYYCKWASDVGTGEWVCTYQDIFNNSLYWNRSENKNAKCGDGGNGSIDTCDFSTTGLQADAKELIADDIIWNIGSSGGSGYGWGLGGGFSTPNAYTKDIYSWERSTNTKTNCSGDACNDGIERKYEWGSADSYEKGKYMVGLMYVSDYGYAVGTNRDTCLNSTLVYNYSESCKTSNWLVPEQDTWTMLAHADTINGSLEFVVQSDGKIYGSELASSKNDVKPVVYLKLNVAIVPDGQEGSETLPYHLVLQ